MSRIRSIPALIAIALCCTAATAATAAAQQVVPSRLQSVAAVDLKENFERVARYNAHVEAANRARLSLARNRTRVAVNALATAAFLGATAMEYAEFTRRLDIGDGTGSDVPGMIAALSFGGAIWTGLKWWDASGNAKVDAASERANVNAAQALLPGIDPLRPVKP